MCYCGEPQDFKDCCEVFHRGDLVAPTAKKLMASRYSAFCTVNVDYLMATTDPQKRFDINPDDYREWASTAEFYRLEIMAAEESGNKAQVEFKAFYRLQGKELVHHEHSKFRKLQGQWYYREGRAGA